MTNIQLIKNLNKSLGPIIPLVADEKRPLSNFRDRPPMTDTEIQELWEKYPHSNVGLRLENLFVIDIDRHNEIDGMKYFKESGLEEFIPDTLRAHTANGGVHIFFKLQKNHELTQTIGALKGVDLKTGKNSYVVIAPSKIGDKVYQFDTSKSSEIAEMPADLAAKIEELQQKNRGFSKAIEPKQTSSGLENQLLFSTQQAGGSNITTQLFHQIANGFEKGERNNQLAALIGGLLYREVERRDVIILARIANMRSAEPLDDNEVNATLKSILDKHEREK